MTVNWDIENNGKIWGKNTDYTSYIQLFAKWELTNNWVIEGVRSWVYSYGNLENNWDINSNYYLSWNPIQWYSNYKLSINWEEEKNVSTTSYKIDKTLTSTEHIKWRVKWDWTLIDSDWWEYKYINTEKTEILKSEFTSIFEKIFTVTSNTETNELEEIELSSAPEAPRCELLRENIYWTRPYNAVCLDNPETSNAWKCNEWYIDMYHIIWVNTCIEEKVYTEMIKDNIWKYIQLRDDVRAIAQKVNEEQAKKLIATFSEKQKKVNISDNKYKWVYNFVIDELLNELDKKENIKAKEFQDLQSYYIAIEALFNDWLYWWWDWYIQLDICKGKTREEIESYIETFADKMFEYNYKHDEEFKEKLDTKIIQEELKLEFLTKQEIYDSIKNWAKNGAKDYFMSYYELKDIDLEQTFDNITIWFKKLFTNPIETIKWELEEIKTDIETIYNRIESLDNIELPDGTSYMWTQVWLSSVDPLWKILKPLLRWKVFGKAKNYTEKLEWDNKKRKEEESKCKATEVYSV